MSYTAAADANFAEFDKLKPILETISRDISHLPLPLNERMAIAAMAASHFMGTAAGLLQHISRQKGGPELDEAAWAEEIMKFVIQLTKRQRH